MRLLLDTHIFLWYVTGDQRLSVDTVSAIRNPQNPVYVSVVSQWEIAIKHQLGKLPLPETPDVYVPRQREMHLMSSLMLDEGSVSRLVGLPNLHRDPFDRMLICQALFHNLVLVSVDPAVLSYPVTHL